MLLTIAASLALLEDSSRAAGEKPVPDGECVALLSQAVGLSASGGKARSAQAGAETQEAPIATAANAARLLRYQMGYNSTLPDAAGAIAIPTAEETQSAMLRLFDRLLVFDIEPYARQLRGKPLRLYRTYAENASVFIEMQEAVRAHTERAIMACVPALARDLSDMGLAMQSPPAPYNLPDWKSLAALYYVFGGDTLDMVRASLSVSLVEAEDGGVTLETRYGAFADIAGTGTRKQFLQAHFANAYLRTAFDETGAAVVAEKRTYDEKYLATIAHPLPGYLVKDGWYDPRDRGTRLHMGTDIRAPGGTAIHSVTDGTVMYIGYLPIPGNYVVVRDPSGYEYHYYHLRERTRFVREGDTVKQGDVLGRVGNTGNSAANHLHVTIVSPEGAYVNPYDLFLAAGLTPIRPNV